MFCLRLQGIVGTGVLIGIYIDQNYEVKTFQSFLFSLALRRDIFNINVPGITFGCVFYEKKNNFWGKKLNLNEEYHQMLSMYIHKCPK